MAAAPAKRHVFHVYTNQHKKEIGRLETTVYDRARLESPAAAAVLPKRSFIFHFVLFLFFLLPPPPLSL
jgi:hypothetical protein